MTTPRKRVAAGAFALATLTTATISTTANAQDAGAERAPSDAKPATTAVAPSKSTGELWETQAQLVMLGMTIGQPMVQRSCVAPGQAVALPQLPRFVNETGCPDLGVQHHGTSWTIDGLCQGARFSMTMREVAPGHREGEFRIDAPLALDSHGGRIVSRRVGTCTPGA